MNLDLDHVDAEVLVARAESETGLSDWDGGSFRSNLQRLLKSLAECDPPPESWRREIEHLAAVLRRRLLLVAERSENPVISDERVMAPLVIVGMPRTGTTFLGGLLARDPDNRCITGFDEEPFSDGFSADLRANELGRFLEQNVSSDQRARLESMHMLNTPPEDVSLLGYEFLRPTPTVRYPLAEFAELVHGAEYTTTYEWHRRLLQRGQHAQPRERWVLRTPVHAHHLPELFATYPDVRVICTHRDPVRVLGSVCSMIEQVRELHWRRSSDRAAVGEEGRRFWVDGLLAKLMAFRAEHDVEAQFFDVRYHDLIADPMHVVRDAYDSFGIPLKPSAESAMTRWADENRQDRYQSRHGAHRYRVENYVDDVDGLGQEYLKYRERFGVVAGV